MATKWEQRVIDVARALVLAQEEAVRVVAERERLNGCIDARYRTQVTGAHLTSLAALESLTVDLIDAVAALDASEVA
jgi:hypothetical protein